MYSSKVGWLWTKVAFVVGLALSLDYLGFDTPTIFNPTWISLACLLSPVAAYFTWKGCSRQPAMAQQGVQHCPMPHDIATKPPRLGVSLFTLSPNPRPLLDLLGGNDQKLQEQMAEGHPYVFKFKSLSLKQVMS